jgi:hypothetical protein
MRYWLEPRWPPIDNEPLRGGAEVLNGLWFHEGKCHVAEKMAKGDKVLLYEVDLHPDTGAHGAKATVAWGIVTGPPNPCEPKCFGGKCFNIRVPFEVKEPHVPWHQTNLGIPLDTVRQILRRTRPHLSDRAPVTRTTLKLEPEEFEALRQELERRCGR